MATIISGKLINGIGEPIKNCKITLKSISTSTTVIAHTTASQTPSAAGDYSMSVEPGKYKVTLCVDGFPPEYVGDIQVYKDSPNGTLNHFLGLPQDNDLRPDAIKHFEAMVDKVASQVAEVEKSKLAAEASARSAAASADRASQITGLSTVTDAISMASVPLPDVWIPFNDSLQMLTGYGEEVKVGNITVAKIVSFKRSTTATYIDKSGTLRTAAINEPRFEKEGLLLEGQSTNLVLYSEDSAQWSVNLNATIEKQSGVYTKISGGDNNCGVYIRVPVTKGRVYTISFYAYADRDHYPVTIGDEPSNTFIRSLNTVPTRYSVTFTAVTEHSVIDAYYGGPGSQIGSFYVGAFQLEELSFASSYIPTKGSQVTRSPDQCYIDAVCNDGLPNPNNVKTFSICSDILGVASDYNFVLNTPVGSFDYNNKAERLSSQITSVERPGVILNKTTVKTASINKNTGKFYIDGQLIGQKTGDFESLSGGRIQIGSYGSVGFIYFHNGHVRNLRIWHSILTEEQIKVIK